MSEYYKSLEDGVYFACFEGSPADPYMIEKENGKWFYADGTGWRSEFDYPEAIVSAESTKGMQRIKRDHVYENTYPLTDFFPK